MPLPHAMWQGAKPLNCTPLLCTASAMSKPTLLLIDASGWIFRAYHGLPPLTSPSGESSGAVYGFAQMLKRMHKDIKAEYIAVVFDAGAKTFRNDLYPDYKATRSATPEDLKPQFPLVLELVRACGLPLLVVPDVEADDVIGTLAVQGQAAGMKVVVITGDKDMAQLVNDDVTLLDTMKNRVMDAAAVREKFGVDPAQIIDYLALMGDASDNIPGVAGVGEKTAAKLLNEHGTLAGVVAAAPTVKGKLGENLRAGLPLLPLCQQLTTIRTDVPLPLTLAELVKAPDDIPRLHALFSRLGFNRLVAELALPPAVASAAPLVSALAPSAEAPAALPPSAPTQAECITTPAQFTALLQALTTAPLICFDTETDGLASNHCRLVGLAFSVAPGTGYYLPLAHNYLGVPAQLPLDATLAALKPLLEDPARPKLAQHGKFDCNVLAQYGIQVQGLCEDTLLQSYVLDAAANRHDMDTLAQKYLGHTTITFADVCGSGKNQRTFDQVDLERASAYSAEDADITLRLHNILYPQLAATPSLLNIYRSLEMPLVPVLAGMEQTGVKIDVPALQALSIELQLQMDALQIQAFEAAGGPFNLGSPKQLGEILYGQLGLPVLARTPKGEPSTAEDALDDLSSQHPLPRLILDWRSLAKLRSTYTETLPHMVNPRTGRIHTSYHQAVAATGRLSSSDPNLQNIPVRTGQGQRIRQAFIAEAGNALCSIDYSQIELRLMAHFSGDRKLQDAFIAGLDIHQATAAEVFGLALDEVKQDQRRAAKAINFGLIYGMSAFGLAKQLGVPRSEAQQYIDRFFARYPGVLAYMDDTKRAAKQRGYVETYFGRRLALPHIASKNQGLRQYAERTAINAPLQGTAADLIKAAMLDVASLLSGQASGVKMTMQVHDELVFEGPRDTLAALAPQLAQCMVQVLGQQGRPAQLLVPLVADFGLGSNWDTAHHASGHASS